MEIYDKLSKKKRIKLLNRLEKKHLKALDDQNFRMVARYMRIMFNIKGYATELDMRMLRLADFMADSMQYKDNVVEFKR